MIVELGHFALVLALLAALSQSFFGLVGPAKGEASWMAAVRPAVYAQFALTSVALAAS